jgi:hypothetical protein
VYEKEKIMPIRFRTLRSAFNKDHFYVRTVQGPVFTLEDAIEALSSGSTLTASDVQAAAIALAEQRDAALLRGQVVDFGPLGTITWRVRPGVLLAKDAPLPRDTDAEFRFEMPKATKLSLLARAVYERVSRSPSQPEISTYRDATTRQENAIYEAGAGGRLVGESMSFDLEDPEQGVFFVAENRMAVRVRSYNTAGDKRIDFSVPVNVTGPQTVEIRTRRKSEGVLLVSEPFGPLAPAT